MAQNKDDPKEPAGGKSSREASTQEKDPKDCFVVGIGASAGGLKALEGFFENLPDDTGMAFVVVQHLDPKQKSHMPEILKRTTSLELSHIKDGEKIKPNRVYFKPPDTDLLIENRRFKLIEPRKSKGVPVAIDVFFRSMASELDGRAIGVILSGAGSDGALGVKEIKGQGGLVIVQDADQADHASMPRKAIATGMVDFVLPVEKMGEKLVVFAAHPLIEKHGIEERKGLQAEKKLQAVLKHVRAKTGCDFSKYKRNTLQRRIARRMAANQIEHIEDYERYLRGNPHEVNDLFKDLLINVTSFFRDEPLFDSLGDKIMRDLVSNAGSEGQLRIWAVGCATGEEAYSLAILLSEAIDEQNKDISFKIFATDINQAAIEKAREGIYPKNIAADVSAERLKRFFVEDDAGYKIEPSLREKVIFAVQDITREPPFSRMDLISCRNLLIYMETELQKKILPIMHYSLNPGGYLLLGTSEGIGDFNDLFGTVDRQNKIFQRRENGGRKYLEAFDITVEGKHDSTDEATEENRAQPPVGGGEKDKPKPEEQTPRIDRILKKAMLPLNAPALIIDGDDRVIYLMGDTSPFLAPPVGQPSFDLRRLIKKEISTSLLGGLDTVRTTLKTKRIEGVRLRFDGRPAETDIEIKPIEKRSSYLMISFEGLVTKPDEEDTDVPAEEERSRVDFLQHKLNNTRHELQATIEELETSNEELKSANEELQANNEEFQSTNEELESSKEELQSTNEELETTNRELHRRNDELARAEDDIKNLFASIDIGVLFLNEELKINRFTPEATRYFSLRDEDIGRSIADITHRLKYENFLDDLNDVNANLSKKQIETETKDGRWLELFMQPYRSRDNVIEGVVVTFKDITRVKELQIYSENIMDTMLEPLVVLTEDLKVVSANQAFFDYFDVEAEQIEGRPIDRAGNWQWGKGDLKSRLNQVITQKRDLDKFELEHEKTGENQTSLRLTARRIARKTEPSLILLMVENLHAGLRSG